MTLLVALFFVLVPLPLLVYLSVKAHERRTAARRAFARARGLTYVEGRGRFFRSQSERIEGEVSGVQVTIDNYTRTSTDSEGRTSSTTYTRVRAYGRRRIRTRVQVYREHIFSGLGRILGFQDVQIGDAAFDGAFTVKADDEQLARELLSAPVRRALIDFPRRPTFAYEGGSLEIVWTGDESDPYVLDAALRVATATCGE